LEKHENFLDKYNESKFKLEGKIESFVELKEELNSKNGKKMN
jgi:hypothetical protein